MEFSGIVTEATIIGTIAGGAIGHTLEHIARRSIEANQEAVLRGHQAVDPNVLQQRGRLHRAAAMLATVGAMTGFCYGEAVSPVNNNHETKPAMTLVVGHPQSAFEDGSYHVINTVSNRVASNNKLNVRISVEHNNNKSLDPMTIKQLEQDYSLGDSNLASVMPSAINEAFSASPVANSNALGSNEQHSGGIVLITDDEAPGNVDTLAAQAHQEGQLPIEVINVGSNDDANAHNLQLLAKKTNGKYVHVSKNNASAAADSFAASITPREVKPPQESINPVPLAPAIVGTVGGIMFFNRRRRSLHIQEGKEDH